MATRITTNPTNLAVEVEVVHDLALVRDLAQSHVLVQDLALNLDRMMDLCIISLNCCVSTMKLVSDAYTFVSSGAGVALPAKISSQSARNTCQLARYMY